MVIEIFSIEFDIPEEKPENFQFSMPESLNVVNIKNSHLENKKSKKRRFMHMYGVETDSIFNNINLGITKHEFKNNLMDLNKKHE